MGTINLNSPNCPSCSGGSVSSAGLPPFYSVDAGIVDLKANVLKTVTFVNIKATNVNQWGMPKSTCLNSSGTEIYPTITKSTTGFTALADEDCTLEYFCIKF